jgi:pimeloyl-ACP methyl ester carboxylesterase
MENALGEIYAQEGENAQICIIGHSIGGWVARAYLGGLSESPSSIYKLTQQRCTSFITLGTPHLSPESALVDQTRGLLKEVESTIQCSPQSLVERGIDVTCVGSTAVQGSIFNVEDIVAMTSYIPLLGVQDGLKARGDGIIPADLAFMKEPARRIEVSLCGEPVRHAHVLPTPWNLLDASAPSLSLPDNFVWYGSSSVIEQWSSFVR